MELLESVLVSPLIGYLDEMAQAKGLLRFDPRSKCLKAADVDVGSIEGIRRFCELASQILRSKHEGGEAAWKLTSWEGIANWQRDGPWRGLSLSLLRSRTLTVRECLWIVCWCIYYTKRYGSRLTRDVILNDR
jgi:hypothetical protein